MAIAVKQGIRNREQYRGTTSSLVKTSTECIKKVV